MKLTVENLGVIPKAEVDLTKSLLLFCGHNNTGKTYLTYFIYGINNIYNIWSYEESFEQYISRYRNITEIQISLNTFCKEYTKQVTEFYSRNISSILPTLFASHNNLFDSTAADIIIRSSELYNIILKQLIQDSYKTFGIEVGISKQINSDFLHITLIHESSKNTFIARGEEDEEDIIEYIINRIFNSILTKNTFIIPAERQGISIFATELTLDKNRYLSQLLKSSRSHSDELLDFSRENINRYATPIREVLDLVADLDSYSTFDSPYSDLADELESQILKGSIAINNNGKLGYTPNGMTKSLDMHTTSSTVKSLSLLTFYLRHIAQEGDFIIIDEPELNLHPDNQVKIARFIARLVNEGFKLLVNTHSDYIIRELNNLIILQSGKEQNKEEFDRLMSEYSEEYNDNQLLKKEDVGVYLFQNHQGEVNVDKINVEADGFEIDTIDQVLIQQNQRMGDIYNSLF
jgi:hypothetical protein